MKMRLKPLRGQVFMTDYFGAVTYLERIGDDVFVLVNDGGNRRTRRPSS